MGAPAVAAFIGFWAFWILLPYGYALDELSPKQIAAFLLLWVCGRIALPHLPWIAGPVLFSPFVVILDIALVFLIFEGDVRLS